MIGLITASPIFIQMPAVYMLHSVPLQLMTDNSSTISLPLLHKSKDSLMVFEPVTSTSDVLDVLLIRLRKNNTKPGIIYIDLDLHVPYLDLDNIRESLFGRYTELCLAKTGSGSASCEPLECFRIKSFAQGLVSSNSRTGITLDTGRLCQPRPTVGHELTSLWSFLQTITPRDPTSLYRVHKGQMHSGRVNKRAVNVTVPF